MHVTMHTDEWKFHTDFPRVIGPYGSPSPRTTRGHYTMLWSHAYGCSMGYLLVLWSRGCKIPYVYPTGSVRFTRGHPRGPCGFHLGMGTSVCSVFREVYGPMQMPCALGNTCMISDAGHYGVWWGPGVYAWVIFTNPWVSEGAPSDAVWACADGAGPCRRRTGFETTYSHSCRPLWGKYRTCRSHKDGRSLDYAWLSTGPQSTEAISESSTCIYIYIYIYISFTHWLYGPNNHQKIVQTCSVVICTVWSEFSLCTYLANKDQSFFIPTVKCNQAELGTHAISVLSCTGSHITVVTCFHKTSLLAYVETNRIKTSRFEAISNEKWKQKCYINLQCVLW